MSSYSSTCVHSLAVHSNGVAHVASGWEGYLVQTIDGEQGVTREKEKDGSFAPNCCAQKTA